MAYHIIIILVPLVVVPESVSSNYHGNRFQFPVLNSLAQLLGMYQAGLALVQIYARSTRDRLVSQGSSARSKTRHEKLETRDNTINGKDPLLMGIGH